MTKITKTQSHNQLTPQYFTDSITCQNIKNNRVNNRNTLMDRRRDTCIRYSELGRVRKV